MSEAGPLAAIPRTVISRWSPGFRAQYGGDLPSNYCVFDLETSGFSHDNDLILQWGHVLVQDCQVVDRLSMYINWYDSKLPAFEIDRRLETIRRHMLTAGHSWNITPELLKSKGVSPDKAFAFLFEYLNTLKAGKVMLVGHQIAMFDTRMLCSHFHQDLKQEFIFPDDLIMDTAGIEKASQMGNDPRVLPVPGETLMGYFRRMAGLRIKGLTYKLGMTIKKYGLDKQAGVDMDLAHTADMDAFLVHRLFEMYRDQLTGGPINHRRGLAPTPEPAQRLDVCDFNEKPAPGLGAGNNDHDDPFAPDRPLPPPVVQGVDLSAPFKPDYTQDAKVAAGMQQELRGHIDRYFDGPAAVKPAAAAAVNYRKQKVR